MGRVGFIVKTKNWMDLLKDLESKLSKGTLLDTFNDSALQAYKTAYRLCPVDTGYMKGQITVEVTGNAFKLRCDCDYADFNEFGWWAVPVGNAENPVHYKGGYRPFMRPGLLDARRYFKKKIHEIAEK